MREFLPRRMFPVISMAFLIIVLTPTPLLADSADPFVFGVGVFMILGLIPIIVIEGLMLWWRLGLEWPVVIRVALVANVASMLVGLIGTAFIPGSISEHTGPAHYYAPILYLLVPLFFVSWLVEYPIALVLGAARARPRPSLLEGMFTANLASYVFLALFVGVSWVHDAWVAPPPGFQSPVGALRTINTSEVTYSLTYTTGYSATLAALDGPAGVATSGNSAGLIDSVLAGGVKSGYRYVYKPGPPDEHGQISSYRVTASPIQGAGHGFYYTDQTGVIRMNPSRSANATDSPLAG